MVAAFAPQLGLSEEILKEASDLVGKSDKDFEDVISQLEQQRQQMESARREAEKRVSRPDRIRLTRLSFSSKGACSSRAKAAGLA